MAKILVLVTALRSAIVWHHHALREPDLSGLRAGSRVVKSFMKGTPYL